MEPDPRVPGYLGRVLGGDDPVGTCFQLAAGVLATAFHVLDDVGAASVGSVVRVDPLQGGAGREARVEGLDPLHDLAVLMTDDPLPASVAGLSASDEVTARTPVLVTGVAGLDDPGHTTRHLPADGYWVGGTTRDDQIRLGVLDSKRVLRGMSGAPVLAGDRVVGVVSGRYNSIDGWARDTVWVARIEDLAPLLGGLAVPAVQQRVMAGPIALTLSVTERRVRLRGGGVDVSGPHSGISRGLADAVHGLRSSRLRLVRAADPAIEPDADGTWAAAGQVAPTGVGRLLAEEFLPPVVATALAEVLARARAGWCPVHLGIDTADPRLRALPWEALALPEGGGPAVLHPLLVVFRHAVTAGIRAVVGEPLRVVVAISAPLDGGGGVLDYERELRNVLAAVRAARQGPGAARVRIVHFATTAEIRAELAREPAHVLHLSGHGSPGVLELEDDDGNAREITAAKFVAEAIPPGRMPAVIALAACHTDAATAAGDPSFAAGLIERGAQGVICTETAVTDVYATRVFAHIYADLAASGAPDVVAAVARARREVHHQLVASGSPREQRLAGLGEWAVLSVLSAAGTLSLFDPASPPQPGADPSPADLLGGARSAGVLPAGLLARDVGEFVGRRRAQRRWPAELLAPGGVGLVLYGIGGVGKTTLAAELVRRTLEREPGRLVVLAGSGLTGGRLSVDGVLAAIARALRRHPDAQGLRVAVADVLERDDVPWQQRWAVLAEHILSELPLLVVADNFEDNLTPTSGPFTGDAGRAGWWGLTDPDLGLLIAALANRPGQARLLVTSRHPFTLPGHADRVLSWRPIGPLSPAETTKLAWTLPGLDRLTEPELNRVAQLVGGHPRCLEYLDALLRGGQANYPDVTARLLGRLDERREIDDLDQWLVEHQTLEPAIAAVLTQAADEVLLELLLNQLAETPGAEELLLDLSVYRRSVDHAGLLFQAGQPDPAAATSPGAAEQRIIETLTAAGVPTDGPIDPTTLPQTVQQAIAADLAALRNPPQPPLRAPGHLRRLVGACTASSLLAIDTNHEPPRIFVHRWTAGELTQYWTDTGRGPQLAAAHHRASDYWRWRVRVWPQDRDADIDDLDEARHHLLAAGDLEQARQLSWMMSTDLHARGAWDREDTLIRHTLTALGDDHPDRSNWIRQLADITYPRGRVREGARLYHQALAIDRQKVELAPDNTGFQRDLSVSHNKVGDLAREAGDRAEAIRRYQDSLAIRQRLVELAPDNTGFQRALSVSHDRVGDLAREAGDRAEAIRRYQDSLAIAQRLVELAPDNTGFQRDLSISHNKVGDLAREAGDRAEAIRRYQDSLAIAQRLVELAPDNTDFQQSFFNACDRLADLATDEEAAAACNDALLFVSGLLGVDHPLTEAIKRRLPELDDRGSV